MSLPSNARRWIGAALIVTLLAGIAVLTRTVDATQRTYIVAYFANSNGLYRGDDVRILGVRVGQIESIEPQPNRAKITFWYDSKYPVPADAKAVILSPSLVTARAVALTPAYNGGPILADRAVIEQNRTAVPIEWDDFRDQLEKLTASLQPTTPGGSSAFGQLVTTAADNLRGRGPSIRDTVQKLAQAFSALGDHSSDIFSTVKNLATLTAALQSSSELMIQLNRNLASVTSTLADDPNEIGSAAQSLSAAVRDVESFVANNKDSVALTAERLASLSQLVVDNKQDVKQLLHVAPTTFQNYINIYQPAQASLSGALALSNFANPIQLLCGAIQAASRLGAEQSAKLCVQYLAPIVKNRMVNFPPIGLNTVVGAQARPNEVTYSEDRLRPDYRPGADAAAGAGPVGPPVLDVPPAASGPLPAEQPTTQTDPALGLPGLMIPQGNR